jgi:hypothetical protein
MHKLNQATLVVFQATAVLLLLETRGIAAPVQAKLASSFVASVGVNVRLSLTYTQYWKSFCTPGTGVVDSLLDLGITTVRDGVKDLRMAQLPASVTNYNSCDSPSTIIDYGHYRKIIKDRILTLNSKGMQLMAVAAGGTIINNGTQNDIRDQIIPDILAVNGAIRSIQTLNEPNVPSFLFKYNNDGFVEVNGTPAETGGGWHQGTQNFLRDLTTAIRGNTSLKSRTIIGPSVAYGWGVEQTSAIDRDRPKNLEPYMIPFKSSDKRLMGTLHNYNAFGHHPGIGYVSEDGGYGWWNCLTLGVGPTSSCSSMQLGSSTGSSTFEGTYPTLPMTATETGYGNRSLTNPMTDPNPSVVTEWVTARYLPRRFLEDYRVGGRLSMSYELIDTAAPGQPHGGFGLIRGDLSRRPSYFTVRGLIKLLKDSKIGFISESLDYLLTPPSGTTTVRQLLFQKSTGEFYLVLWNEVSNWSVDTSKQPAVVKEIRTTPVNSTLQVNTPVSELTLYKYNESDPQYPLVASSLTLKNGQVQIPIPDLPIFIKITRS